MFPKAQSTKDILIHLGIMAGIFLAIVILFFYVWLPFTTNHGETITVPKLQGMEVNQLEGYLDKRDLRYEINDSTFIPGAKPYTVISQHPVEGSKVKQNRKIYITVASKNPPRVKMPSLVDKSLKSAELELKASDLVKGRITYVASSFNGLVFKQLVDGKDIKAGTDIAKGTVIDLVVGSNNGGIAADVDLPNLVGMDIEEAKAELEKLQLVLGAEKQDLTSTASVGTVTKQRPEYVTGTRIHAGQTIDLWVSGEGTP